MPIKKYYQKYKQQTLKYNKEYNAAHKEEKKKQWELYYNDNREEIIEKEKKRYKKNRTAILAKSKQDRKDHPEKYAEIDFKRKRQPKERFRQGKTGAKRRDLTWTLTFDEFQMLIQQPCHYCNYELGKPVETSAGLDRLNNDLGYESQNVVSCCELCNKLRNIYLSPEQTKVAVLAIIDYNNLHQG